MRSLIYACVIVCCTYVVLGQNLEIELPRPGATYYGSPGIPVEVKGVDDVNGLIWQLSLDSGRTYGKPKPEIDVFGPITRLERRYDQCFMWVSGINNSPKRVMRVLPLTSKRTLEDASLVVIPRHRKTVLVAYGNTPGVTVIDLANAAHREVSFSNPNRVAVISRDGRYAGIYENARRGLTQVFDIGDPKNPVYAIPSLIGGMQQYAFIGDSKELLFSSGASLKRLDTSGSKVVAERVFSKSIYRLYQTPDSSKFLVNTADSVFLIDVETLKHEWSVSSTMQYQAPPHFSADETLFSYESIYSFSEAFEVRELETGLLVRRDLDHWSDLSVMRDADTEIGLIPPIMTKTDHTRGKRSLSLGRVDDTKYELAVASRWDLAQDSVLIATATRLYFIDAGSKPWIRFGETSGTFSVVEGVRPDRSFSASIESLSTRIGVDTSFTYRLVAERPDDIPDLGTLELELEWDAQLALPRSPTPIGTSDGVVRRVRIPIQMEKDVLDYQGVVNITTALGRLKSTEIKATMVHVGDASYSLISQDGVLTIADTCLRYPRSNSFLDDIVAFTIVWRGNEITVRSLDGSKVDHVSVSDMSGNIIPTIADQIDVVTGRSTYIVPEVARGVYTVSVYSNGRRATSLVFRSKE